MATPPINVVGQFTVKDPFDTVPGAIYKCESIQGFEALDLANVDIYAQYYQPFGLPRSAYDHDRLNSVDIVTLISLSAPPIVLPSSYITSFPNVESIPYHQTLVVFDLGILPDGFDLSSLSDQCRQVFEDGVGVDVTPMTVTHPVSDVVDASQHEQLTNARIANQNITDSYYKRMRELEKQVQALQTRNAALAETLSNLL